MATNIVAVEPTSLLSRLRRLASEALENHLRICQMIADTVRYQR